MGTDTRRRTRITIAAVALLAGVVAVPVANGAVSGDEDDTKAQGNHCTLDVGSEELECFDSLDDATGIDGGQRLLDASTGKAQAEGETRKGEEPVASSGLATKDDDEDEDEPEKNIVSATLFTETQYGGKSLTIKHTELCDGDEDDVDFELDLAEEWQGEVSSVQPWGNCTLNLFSETGTEGERDGPFKELTPNLGEVMNDRAKSISFS